MSKRINVLQDLKLPEWNFLWTEQLSICPGSLQGFGVDDRHILLQVADIMADLPDDGYNQIGEQLRSLATSNGYKFAHVMKLTRLALYGQMVRLCCETRFYKVTCIDQCHFNILSFDSQRLCLFNFITLKVCRLTLLWNRILQQGPSILELLSLLKKDMCVKRLHDMIPLLPRDESQQTSWRPINYMDHSIYCLLVWSRSKVLK